MSKHKLKICEYFDNLIGKIDEIVETVIACNHHDAQLVDAFNKQRDLFLDEIRHAQTFNLNALPELKPTQSENLKISDLFPKFCFLIKHDPRDDSSSREKKIIRISDEKKIMFYHADIPKLELGVKLIVTDMYLTDGQIKCFENLFNHSFYTEIDKDLFFEKNQKYVIFC
jgi:hypothetical protein